MTEGLLQEHIIGILKDQPVVGNPVVHTGQSVNMEDQQTGHLRQASRVLALDMEGSLHSS